MKIKKVKGDRVLLKEVIVKQEVMKIKGVAIQGISTNDSSIGEVLYIGDSVDSSIKKGMMFIVPLKNLMIAIMASFQICLE